MRWAAHVASMGKEKKVFKVLVGKKEGKKNEAYIGGWDQN
jgi:hypothetical protein